MKGICVIFHFKVCEKVSEKAIFGELKNSFSESDLEPVFMEQKCRQKVIEMSTKR
jgi:hypothetical protein